MVNLPPPPPPGGFTAWHAVALVGGVLLFFLLLAILALLYRDRSERRRHDQQMQALQRGLLPPEWTGTSQRRFGWLWLALGLPIFVAFAGGIGTALLVDASMRGGRSFTEAIVAIWIVGGAVGLASVIMGGLGMMADQRRQQRLPPPLDYPPVRLAPPETDSGRDPTAERIWKQEGS
jgi:hypothetical protein